MTKYNAHDAQIIGIAQAARHNVEEASKEISMKQGMDPFEDVAAFKKDMRDNAQAQRRITENL